MAISSSTRKAGPFVGNDATTVFPFAFKVFTAADLLVVNTSALGVESDLVLDVDYTVTLNADQDNDPGGSVTRLAALPTGERLTITSDVPALQPLVLTNNGGFYPRVINDAFDKITIIAQQLIEQVGRSLKLPISSTASATLPDPVANSLIAWNGAANGFANVAPGDLVAVAGYADARIEVYEGDGVETDFEIDFHPGVLANLDVSLSGVTQIGGVDFTWLGTTVMFTVPPPNGVSILIRYARPLSPLPDFDSILTSVGDAEAAAEAAEAARAAAVAATSNKLNLNGDNVGGNAATLRAAIGADLAANVNLPGAGTGGVNQTVASILNSLAVSPERYGAVGDGVTNDGPAFQSAINYINSLGGGRLRLTPGKNYFLNQQINLCNDLCVWGYGAKITVGTAFAGIQRPLFKSFTGTDTNTPGPVLATRNLSFFGIEFIGGSTGIPATLIPDDDMRGMIICIGGWDNGSGADNVVVRDCNMHDFAGAGVMLWHCTNVDVSNNTFNNFFANVGLAIGSAIDFHECDGGTVIGNKIDHTATGYSWHGMVLLDWNNESKNLVVMGNVITNMNRGDGISCEGNGGAGSNGQDFVISNNIILDCFGEGVDLYNCISVKCSDNIIRRVGGIGILATNCTYWEAIGNTIEDCSFGGILCVSGAVRATVLDNTINNINYYDANYRGHGIEVIDNSFTAGRIYTICNNTVVDTDGAGIFAYCAVGKISGNTIHNAGRSASNPDQMRAGIRSAVGTSVGDNNISSSGTTLYGLSSGASNFPSCAGNKFIGTFTLGWYYIAYRVGNYLDISTTIYNLVYDSVANVMTGAYNGTPAGYFYVGDTMYATAPVSAGYIGSVVVTSGTTWKTFGEISP